MNVIVQRVETAGSDLEYDFLCAIEMDFDLFRSPTQEEAACGNVMSGKFGTQLPSCCRGRNGKVNFP
jgi:hypothetical protein